MEKKLGIYKKYHDNFGVSLNKGQREKLIKQYDEPSVELLLSRRMFDKRMVEAALRI